MDFLLPVLLIAFMGFILYNSSRQRKRQAALIESASVVGTEVMLGSGIYGTITAVEGDRVTLKSGSSTLVVAKGAIMRTVNAAEPAAAEPTATATPVKPAAKKAPAKPAVKKAPAKPAVKKSEK
jgi:preprotein translocase subunit YajC